MQPYLSEVELIVAAAPEFRPDWEKFRRTNEDEQFVPLYSAMGELAHYVIEKYERGKTAEFPDLFGTVERVLANADDELANLIAVGLFEDIQNIASHRSFRHEVFMAWLGDRSKIVWREVDEGMKSVAEFVAAENKKQWWQFWKRAPRDDVDSVLSTVQNKELRKIIESNFRRRI